MQRVAKAGDLLGDTPITQELVAGSAARYLEVMEARGEEESLEYHDLQMQLHGGPCRWCGKPWTTKSVDDGKSYFVYCVPTCSCLRKAREAEDHMVSLHLEEAMETADIPARFRALSFEVMSRDVSKGVSEAFDAVQTYLRERRYESGRGLVLLGAVGTGKTSCGAIALKEMLKEGMRCRFVQTASLTDQIIRNRERGGYVEALLSCDAIMLDDLDKVSTESEWTRSQVFSIIDAAYSEKVALVVTSSAKDVAELGNRFGRDIMSRIAGSADLIRFDGEDFRRRR